MKVVADRKLSILDFDIENRPLSYWMPDRPTAEVTAIAWSWVGSSKVYCRLLDKQVDGKDMLEEFYYYYQAADMVTGHYIRKHDLPILNGAMIEFGLPTLGSKLTQDTKLDMVRKADIAATQENLSDMLGIRSKKYHMTQAAWREANRLTPEGLALTEKRVVADVKQHKQLRLAMLKAGLLKPPRRWNP